MTGKNVIVLVAENAESEVGRFGDINEIIVAEETVRSDGPVRLGIVCMGHIDGIGREGC